MQALKIRKVGNSLGLVLPREAVSRLNVRDGDIIYLTDAKDGGFRLTPLNEQFAAQMAIAEDVMREDRDVLRALAKR